MKTHIQLTQRLVANLSLDWHSWWLIGGINYDTLHLPGGCDGLIKPQDYIYVGFHLLCFHCTFELGYVAVTPSADEMVAWARQQCVDAQTALRDAETRRDNAHFARWKSRQKITP